LSVVLVRRGSDARWLCLLSAKEMLPESWLPPAEIQALRDQTRLRKALAEDRTRFRLRVGLVCADESGDHDDRGERPDRDEASTSASASD
jgi:hypothetical protein